MEIQPTYECKVSPIQCDVRAPEEENTAENRGVQWRTHEQSKRTTRNAGSEYYHGHGIRYMCASFLYSSENVR